MSDINKSDIKLMQSQRLDDTDEGGGQMTANEVVDGEVNNLFPDISRLDRVYGRVSMRKAYLAVQTAARETYYGSHTIITEQAADPNVSVCFFSNEDWFDIREEARDRIEAYLVKGPQSQMSLWGDHYRGTSSLSYFTERDWPSPEVGDVLVIKDTDNEQYARIIDVSDETRDFFVGTTTYYKKIISITIGTQLAYDFSGEEVSQNWTHTDDDTKTYTTVAADASRYYGVATLTDAATAGELQIKVDDIQTNLVPSAASQTAITDAGVGTSISPLIQTQDEAATVTRSVSFNITTNSKLYIGEGIIPGSFQWSGGITLDDGNGTGNIYNGSTIVGSIAYDTGIITFGNPGITTSGTGVVTYIPACTITQVSQTGGIVIDTNNRGFVYTFSCDPIPKAGTLKVEYLASGKWYSMWDRGNGQILGSDDAIGSGSINMTTGSVSITLGAMPDVDSMVLFFWAKPSEYYDLSGETLPLEYRFTTNNPAVARNTFSIAWVADGLGTGPNGEYAVRDNGNADIVEAEFPYVPWIASTAYVLDDTRLPITRNGFLYRCTTAGTTDVSEPTWPAVVGQTVADGTAVWECMLVPVDTYWSIKSPETVVGYVRYATGEVYFSPPAVQPSATENFNIKYNYGDPTTETFFAPPRDGSGHINFDLNPAKMPFVPGTFRIEWHTDLVKYEVETRLDMTLDPTYIFIDDSSGNFDGDVNDGTSNWIKGTVNYTTGAVQFHPDRTSTFPIPQYDWKITAWLHPGVEESRVFTGVQYLPTLSEFPTDGSVVVSYVSVDGTNLDEYSGTLTPIYTIKEDKQGLEIIPGSLSVEMDGNYLLDGTDGKLYIHSDGVENTRTEVGSINYVNKTFSISSDSFQIGPGTIKYCSGTAAIEPMQSMVFRAPGAPITPGSAFIKGTTGEGRVVQGTTDFSGNIQGDGIQGHVDFNTGLCFISFGEWVLDDATAQAQDWYKASLNDGAGNIWKPFVVQASTILMNCVIESYLPLDAELLGLDPVRLPLDGKVPIFRDGYIIVIHHSKEEYMPYPLGTGSSLPDDYVGNVGRADVDLIEAYAVPTDVQISEGTQTVPMLITETDNYTYDLTTGDITFLSGFTYPIDSYGTLNQIIALSRIEDMALASDVQVTGHIAITSPLIHSYVANETLVSSVLPSADLQSRAYNEFEQESWTSEWSDERIGSKPLASYNFVDYPITVVNEPSIKERWLILFDSSTSVTIVGENFGVLAEGVSITTGNANIGGNNCIAIENRQFSGQYYFVIRCDGFGAGWASGNCIRFNQDAANFPLWFVRTTLQAPPTEPIDHYTIQIRGDSS